MINQKNEGMLNYEKYEVCKYYVSNESEAVFIRNIIDKEIMNRVISKKKTVDE